MFSTGIVTLDHSLSGNHPTSYCIKLFGALKITYEGAALVSVGLEGEV